MVGLFDKFKEEDSEGSEMVEERPSYEENEPENSQTEPEAVESTPEGEYRSELTETRGEVQQATSSGSDIGISSLMDKRAKLEEAIDYVGMMISNLKEKRTGLEKEIVE